MWHGSGPGIDVIKLMRKLHFNLGFPTSISRIFGTGQVLEWLCWLYFKSVKLTLPELAHSDKDSYKLDLLGNHHSYQRGIGLHRSRFNHACNRFAVDTANEMWPSYLQSHSAVEASIRKKELKKFIWLSKRKIETKQKIKKPKKY